PAGNIPWETPLTTLAGHPKPPRVLIGGDMNLHHPSWDFNHPQDPAASQLLQLAANWRLNLITPPGTVTRSARRDRDSTIDLIWASDDLQLLWGGTPPVLRGSDHLPQEVSFSIPRAALGIPSSL